MRETIRQTRLEHGPVVITEQLPHLRSLTVGLWAGLGSRDEPAARAGLVHGFEHLVFKGTRRRSAREISRALEAVGGMLNAFTSREQVCFYAKVMDENTSLALDVLFDLLTEPRLRPADVRREIPVIREEIRAAEDNPEERVHDLLFRAIWPGAGLGRPIAGTAASVARLAAADLQGLHRRLRRSPLLVTAVGSLDHGRLAAEARRRLERFVPAAAAAPARPVPRPGRTCLAEERPIQVSNLCLGAPGLSFTDEERYPLLFLNTILGEGMSSRLFQSVRETHGLAYSVYSNLDFFADTGLFLVFAGTDPGKAGPCLRLICRELRRLQRDFLTKKEIRFARSFIKGNLMLSLESSFNRMGRLARGLLYQGQVETVPELIRRINAVTPDQVRSLARTLLRPERFSLCRVGPKLKEKIGLDDLDF